MARKYGKTRRRMRRRSRRRFRKRAIPNLRYFKHKVTQVIPIIAGNSSFTLLYMQRQGIIANVYGHNGSERFQRVVNNYEQYAVTGMSVKWILINIRGSRDSEGQYKANVLGSVLMWDDIDTYDTTGYSEAQIVALDSFKLFDPIRTWKQYRFCKKIAKQQQTKWLDPETLPIAGAYPVPNTSMTIRCQIGQTEGLNPPDSMGYVKVKWYITFRGQQ